MTTPISPEDLDEPTENGERHKSAIKETTSTSDADLWLAEVRNRSDRGWYTNSDIIGNLIARIDLERNRADEAERERDHWKANHDDQVRIKRQLHERFNAIRRVVNAPITSQAVEVEEDPSASQEARQGRGPDVRDSIDSEGIPGQVNDSEATGVSEPDYLADWDSWRDDYKSPADAVAAPKPKEPSE